MIRLRGKQSEPKRLALRLARELKVWAELDHPHILPLLGYYLDIEYKTAILISEYMPCGDLKEYLDREDPPFDLRFSFVRLECLSSLTTANCASDSRFAILRMALLTYTSRLHLFIMVTSNRGAFS